MEASIRGGTVVSSCSNTILRGGRVADHPKSRTNIIPRIRLIRSAPRLNTSAAATINDLSAAPVEVSWQIVVGAFAGVTPFVVAGIEFSKRIMKQRKCGLCGGSGLVLRDKYYFRCPGCGGFLPWQSWKRFFSG